MWVKSVIETVGESNLLIYPIYRPSLFDHHWLDYECIKDFHLGDVRKQHGDGRGHCNQEGHVVIATQIASDVLAEWFEQLDVKL